MEKTIIENGGRVIDDIAQAFFVVEEDGWDKEIWKQDKSREQVKVSFRFISESIKENGELAYEDMLHLCPLPHRVPIKKFENFTIEIGMATSPLD